MHNKTRSYFILGALALHTGFSGIQTYASEQVILSMERPGQIVFNEVSNATAYRVEWASSLEDPWEDFTIYAGHGLDFIPATGEGAITAAVPMFYRVVAMEPERTPVNMIALPGGTFHMGNLYDPLEGAAWELPVRTVTLDPFSIAETPVTGAQWRPVYNWALENGYVFDYLGSAKGPHYPIVWMNWYDIVKWCNAKSEKNGFTPCYTVDGGLVYTNGHRDDVACDWAADGYRLPTEAEWEYAARGGTTNRFPWGDRISNESNANYNARCKDGVFEYAYDDGPFCGTNPEFLIGMFHYSPVDRFPANGFGLYDMTGNTMEWVWDWLSVTYYEDEPAATNPRGPDEGVIRAMRGGNYLAPPNVCRVSSRLPYPPDLYGHAHGFRVARSNIAD